MSDTPGQDADAPGQGASTSGQGAETPARDAGAPAPRSRPQRQAMLLRLDPAVHEALVGWAADEFRSVNAQVELVLRRALTQAGRAPKDVRPLPRRGRPPADRPPTAPPPPTRGQ